MSIAPCSQGLCKASLCAVSFSATEAQFPESALICALLKKNLKSSVAENSSTRDFLKNALTHRKKSMKSPIVPMSDSELMNIARQSRLESYTGWKWLKEVTISRFKKIDLSDVQVLEAVSTHLVKRPIDEAQRIRNSINSDIKEAQKHLDTLRTVRQKIDPSPTEAVVEELVGEVKKDIAMRAREVLVNNSPRGQYYVNDDCRGAVSSSNKVDTSDERTKRLVMLNIKPFINSLTKGSVEELTDAVRSYIVREWTEIKVNQNRQMGVSPNQHPVVKELYASHVGEVDSSIERLERLVTELEAQHKHTNEIIAPIQKMANDLRSYLQVADDIRSVREAVSFLDTAEVKNLERGNAISVLASYSEIAMSALGEVKSTLDSYQSAQKEMSEVSVQALGTV